jgi:hypothetical protein
MNVNWQVYACVPEEPPPRPLFTNCRRLAGTVGDLTPICTGIFHSRHRDFMAIPQRLALEGQPSFRVADSWQK